MAYRGCSPMADGTAIALLERLVSFPTVAGESNEELVAWVAERLEGAGAAVRILPGPRPDGHGLHAVFGPADVPGVLLSAHTDVVSAEGQAWTHDPYVLHAVGGRLVGRGTTDMKGFIAALLAVVQEIRAAALREPLHVALSADEELGCLGTPSLLDGLAGIAEPRWCLVGEPTGMRVVERHKGKVGLRVAVSGLACHSSRAPEGVNAVEAAARLIVRLGALRDELHAAATDDRFGIPHATLSVGPIRGGTALNVVPDACTFDVEARSLPTQDPGSIEAAVRRMAGELEAELRADAAVCRVAVTALAGYPALAEAPLQAASVEVAALAGGGRDGSADFGTEAGLLQQALRVPVVVCGPGDMIQAHVADEFLEVEQLRRAENFLRRLAGSLGIP